MGKLTDRGFAPFVNLNSLIHIVNTGDTSQSPDGSSYKASLSDLSTLFTGTSNTFTGNTSADCITNLWVSNVHGCSPITIHDSIQTTGSTSNGLLSFTFGLQNTASGIASHAEGSGTTAIGDYSHSSGVLTISSGDSSHAEGYLTTSIGQSSHSEGALTTSIGVASHAEGRNTAAIGQYSHAEGSYTIASGNSSHAGGCGNIIGGAYVSAIGNASFAHMLTTEGSERAARGDSSVILGGLNHDIFSGATNSVILGGANNIINVKVINSVVLGGSNISASTSNTVYVGDFVIKKSAAVPSNSDDSIGEVGSITWDNNYIYWKTNTGWLRISGSTF
jgi:hypothetical protein